VGRRKLSPNDRGTMQGWGGKRQKESRNKEPERAGGSFNCVFKASRTVNVEKGLVRVAHGPRTLLSESPWLSPAILLIRSGWGGPT